MAGNSNSGRREKPFFTALMMEIKEAGADNRRLRDIAKVLISKAADGDTQAMAMLFDRLDGKPMQAVEHTGEDGGPVQFLTIYETDKPK